MPMCVTNTIVTCTTWALHGGMEAGGSAAIPQTGLPATCPGDLSSDESRFSMRPDWWCAVTEPGLADGSWRGGEDYSMPLLCFRVALFVRWLIRDLSGFLGAWLSDIKDSSWGNEGPVVVRGV